MSHEKHISLRLDDETIEVADRISELHSKVFGLNTTRSAVLRAALYEGLAMLVDQYASARGRE